MAPINLTFETSDQSSAPASINQRPIDRAKRLFREFLDDQAGDPFHYACGAKGPRGATTWSPPDPECTTSPRDAVPRYQGAMAALLVAWLRHCEAVAEVSATAEGSADYARAILVQHAAAASLRDSHANAVGFASI